MTSSLFYANIKKGNEEFSSVAGLGRASGQCLGLCVGGKQRKGRTTESLDSSWFPAATGGSMGTLEDVPKSSEVLVELRPTPRPLAPLARGRGDSIFIKNHLQSFYAFT